MGDEVVGVGSVYENVSFAGANGTSAIPGANNEPSSSPLPKSTSVSGLASSTEGGASLCKKPMPKPRSRSLFIRPVDPDDSSGNSTAQPSSQLPSTSPDPVAAKPSPQPPEQPPVPARSPSFGSSPNPPFDSAPKGPPSTPVPQGPPASPGSSAPPALDLGVNGTEVGDAKVSNSGKRGSTETSKGKKTINIEIKGGKGSPRSTTLQNRKPMPAPRTKLGTARTMTTPPETEHEYESLDETGFIGPGEHSFYIIPPHRPTPLKKSASLSSPQTPQPQSTPQAPPNLQTPQTISTPPVEKNDLLISKDSSVSEDFYNVPVFSSGTGLKLNIPRPATTHLATSSSFDADIYDTPATAPVSLVSPPLNNQQQPPQTSSIFCTAPRPHKKPAPVRADTLFKSSSSLASLPAEGAPIGSSTIATTRASPVSVQSPFPFETYDVPSPASSRVSSRVASSALSEDGVTPAASLFLQSSVDVMEPLYPVKQTPTPEEADVGLLYDTPTPAKGQATSVARVDAPIFEEEEEDPYGNVWDAKRKEERNSHDRSPANFSEVDAILDSLDAIVADVSLSESAADSGVLMAADASPDAPEATPSPSSSLPRQSSGFSTPARSLPPVPPFPAAAAAAALKAASVTESPIYTSVSPGDSPRAVVRTLAQTMTPSNGALIDDSVDAYDAVSSSPRTQSEPESTSCPNAEPPFVNDEDIYECLANATSGRSNDDVSVDAANDTSLQLSRLLPREDSSFTADDVDDAADDAYAMPDDGDIYGQVWVGRDSGVKPVAQLDKVAAPASARVSSLAQDDVGAQKLLREMALKPAGHRGPLATPPMDAAADENDFVVLQLPPRRWDRECPAGLLPPPISGGARDYHARCGDGVVLRNRKSMEDDVDFESKTAPETSDENFDLDWKAQCDAFNRLDYLRSSSSSAPSRVASDPGSDDPLQDTYETPTFPRLLAPKRAKPEVGSSLKTRDASSLLRGFDPLLESGNPKDSPSTIENDQIYDDVTEDDKRAVLGTTTMTTLKVVSAKPPPIDYHVLHFEKKSLVSTAQAQKLPPPVPPHAVDHSTYEPVDSGRGPPQSYAKAGTVPDGLGMSNGPSALMESQTSYHSAVGTDDGVHDDRCSTDGDPSDSDVIASADDDDDDEGRVRVISLPSLSSLDDHGSRLLESGVRQGWLYKLTKTPAGTNRWVKRWLRLTPHEGDDRHEGGVLKYFVSDKDPLSRQVIRGSRILNVTQKVGPDGETRKFRLVITALNREYVFAADTCDAMCQWSMSIMQIIPKELQSRDSYKPGGDMNQPDKSGFLRLEAVEQTENPKALVGRRFLAIKGAIMCIYKEEKDFVDDSPAVELEMKLGCVKDLTPASAKHPRFQLVHVPHVRFTFAAETLEEMREWQEAMRDATAAGLSTNSDEIWSLIRENPSNRFCADCGRPDPEWAVVNWGLVVCKDCSGAHRELGVSYSKVRSLKMDQGVWIDDVIELTRAVGNENANRMWEYYLDQEKINADSSKLERKNYVIMKYKMRKFCNMYPMKGDQEALDRALAKNVQTPELMTTMRLIATGADVSTRRDHVFGGRSLMELARRSGQVLQAALLSLHGADADDAGPSPFLASNALESSTEEDGIAGSRNSVSWRNPHSRSRIGHTTLKDFLLKEGGPRGRFARRFCVLDAGSLKYFDDEESTAPKGTVDLKDVVLVSDPHQSGEDANSFEITIPSRTYTFAAENSEKKKSWKSCLAMNLLPPQLFDFVDDGFTRCGKLLVKDSIKTGDSSAKAWAVLNKQFLALFLLLEEHLVDLDLRKNVYGVRAARDGDGEGLVGAAGHHLGFLPVDLGSSPQILVDLPEGRTLALQAEGRKETESWLNFIREARKAGAGCEEQLLTKDNVPVIVEECLAFILSHGLSSPGIYRRSGSAAKVAALLARFRDDARAVKLRLTEGEAGEDAADAYGVEDVANVLKKFFSQLPDALLLTSLHDEWCDLMRSEDASPSDERTRLRRVKNLLRQLPVVNYATLKALLVHLRRISRESETNLMDLKNLSAIFGPTLMSTSSSVDGFERTSEEIRTIYFLTEHLDWLFDVSAGEREKEEQAFEKLKIMQSALKAPTGGDNGGFLFSVLVETSLGDGRSEMRSFQVHLFPGMTAREVTHDALHLANAPNSDVAAFAAFETVANSQLERLVHFDEDVFALVSAWGKWNVPPYAETPGEKSALVLKKNYILQDLKSRALLQTLPSGCLLSELQVSEKAAWKKMTVEFLQAQILFYAGKNKKEMGRWRIEDVNVYLGVEKPRLRGLKREKGATGPPLGITFVSSGDPLVISKDTPFIGRSLIFPDADVYFRWVAGLLLTKHNGRLCPPDSLPPPTPRNAHPPVVVLRSAAAALQTTQHHHPQHPAHIAGAVPLFPASMGNALRRQITSRQNLRSESEEG